MSKYIEVLDQVKELKEPYWERQEGESSEWYEKFFIYYLQQTGNRSVENAVLSYCKVHKVIDDLKYEQMLKKWQIISERNLWLERELAYDDARYLGVSSNEITILEKFKDESQRIVETGMQSASGSLALTGELIRQYALHIKKNLTNKQGEINFDEFDDVKYGNLIKSLKTSAETAKLLTEIGNSVLGLEEIIRRMNENNELGDLID